MRILFRHFGVKGRCCRLWTVDRKWDVVRGSGQEPGLSKSNYKKPRSGA